MAAKTKPETKAEAAVQVEAKAPVVEAAPKFVVEKLRSNCVELYGVTTSTFDGAMYGHDHDSMYSVDEVGNIIKKFLNGGK